jgi:peptidyl-prolyl cis-trans isomerase A (cyclophilin A)
MKALLKSLLLTAVLMTSALAAHHENPKVLIKTTLGDITVSLNADKAPLSVANFLEYVDSGFYNGTIFHRVIRDFMIQGGGLTPDMDKKTTNASIKNESKNGLKNVRGSIAMARTNSPHTATSQFFINHKNNDFLNGAENKWGYAVFGMVTDGMDVVDFIANERTTRKDGRGDVPVTPILIQSITRL